MSDMHDKVWGTENWVVNCDKYCMKVLKLNKNSCCSAHYHKEKDEVFYIVSGLVQMEICKDTDGGFKSEIDMMYPESYIRVMPNTIHRFTGIQDSVIIECSSQHFEEDSYRLSESKKIVDANKKLVERSEDGNKC